MRTGKGEIPKAFLPVPTSSILSGVADTLSRLESRVAALFSAQPAKRPSKLFSTGHSEESSYEPGRAPLVDLTGNGTARTYDRSSFQNIERRFGSLIHQAAQKFGMGKDGERLITSVMLQESKGNPRATSRAGARGLMQLMPKTAASLGYRPRNLSDPKTNIEAGAKYLHQLQGQFDNVGMVAAAYNAGPGAVARYGGVPPYAETEQYVRNVVANYATIPQ
jgi:hypothetical protein